MNDLVLKYRMRNLSTIVGHKQLVTELKKRSKDLNFPQVMLFSGSSGSGKTTLAMMIAQLLNCDNPIKNENGEYEPCGECSSCKDVQKEKFERNIYFMDCSTMGKDDVIDLSTRANQAPMYDKKNIFILEEAQELSKAGLGATLKLLEKPRANTHFILTTMEVGKIDKAIQSRSQHYKLKPVLWDDIMDHLGNILEKEGVFETVPESFIEEGLPTICEAADGNVRMAVQYLERCLYGEYWTKDLILSELNFMDSASSSEIILSLLKGDKTVIRAMQETEFLSFFRMSWRNIADTLLYRDCGYIKNPYRERYLKPLALQPRLNKLNEIFIEVYEKGPYLDENLFYTRIAEFLKVPTLTEDSNRPMRQARPVRS